MEVSGALSSWLTMARNSVRNRSCSSTSAMSCMVTATDSITPSSERMGVALSSTVMLRPSGTRRTISSARSVSPSLSSSAMGSSRKETSRPSARMQVIASSSTSGDWPGSRRLFTILRASRLRDFGAPARRSSNTTPTGVVSTSVSRSARARRSSRCVWALAITSAACEANMTRVSSSARLNSSPPSLPPTKMWPTRAPRWNIGTARKQKAPTGRGMLKALKPSERTCSSRSGEPHRLENALQGTRRCAAPPACATAARPPPPPVPRRGSPAPRRRRPVASSRRSGRRSGSGRSPGRPGVRCRSPGSRSCAGWPRSAWRAAPARRPRSRPSAHAVGSTRHLAVTVEGRTVVSYVHLCDTTSWDATPESA